MQLSDNTNIIFQANFATKLLQSLLHLAEVQTVSTGFNLFPSEIHVCLSEAKFFQVFTCMVRSSSQTHWQLQISSMFGLELPLFSVSTVTLAQKQDPQSRNCTVLSVLMN